VFDQRVYSQGVSAQRGLVEVSLARFKSRHCGLIGVHPTRYLDLSQTQLVSPGDQILDKFPVSV